MIYENVFANPVERLKDDDSVWNYDLVVDLFYEQWQTVWISNVRDLLRCVGQFECFLDNNCAAIFHASVTATVFDLNTNYVLNI